MTDTPSAAHAGRPAPPLAIAAVLLFSHDADRLARFYRDDLGAPLQPIRVAGLPPHWATDIGQVYLSIWPVEGEGDDCASVEAPRGGVALYVRSVVKEFERLAGKGVPVVFPPRRTAVGVVARLRDPDGNPFELYQPLPR